MVLLHFLLVVENLLELQMVAVIILTILLFIFMVLILLEVIVQPLRLGGQGIMQVDYPEQEQKLLGLLEPEPLKLELVQHQL